MKSSNCLTFATLVALCLITLVQGRSPCVYKRNETPCYQVLSTSKDGNYELRKYSPSVWVKTKAEMAESFWEKDTDQPFFKLFRYTAGENKQGKRVKMTSPVLLSHTRDEVQMYFMLPTDMENNPPTPTRAGVDVFYNPGGEFYVRQIDGRPNLFNNNEYKKELNDLKQTLSSDGMKIDTDLFFTANYNAPYTIRKRRNEIWIPKK